MLTMSSGLISPSRGAPTSRGGAALPATSSLNRSVIGADGAIALTQTLCGAQTTASERVIATIPPLAAVY
jgi:hypothetical protein